MPQAYGNGWRFDGSDLGILKCPSGHGLWFLLTNRVLESAYSVLALCWILLHILLYLILPATFEMSPIIIPSLQTQKLRVGEVP